MCYCCFCCNVVFCPFINISVLFFAVLGETIAKVGGNSGSPVMNKRGELVGINFDRQRQGLMNEFKWSHAYSRSIGVDVRYILWLIGNYDHADHLIDEMISYD